ncbi:serine dehydratase subunit alpha family protein [Providencia hangzhouensis]|uniref:L-cysteine desulfidase family protein n=1 Tax=Providencia TaxID=586 RepID=UPI000D9832EF|nr:MULTISPECIES: L-serine ammonia-lyase, iron-sulfur-dependent, subunit alpha [Providencia]PYZ60449.1 serine dehydratase subunit alpha family protein [Providencia rettgeri]QIF64969.1 serine dehydratase subunit alpha family protein [Providencia sp. 1709051003]WOB96168.1 L-serine ammonia-lyase, iron-sulfur-dependent, subunit alpha [Providencia sp. PROV099]
MHAQSQPLLWQYFINAVKQEVKPALGCTEPISLAYAAAKAASFLDGKVTRVCAFVSPNLMKNGMGVTVPGTGMVGLPIAAALGAVGGDAEAGLEVLKSASADAIALSKTMLAQGAITVDIKHPCDDVIYSEATVYTQTESATVIIAGSHTNIVKIIHNNHTVFDATTAQPHHESPVDCAADVPLPPVTAKSVYQFATEAPLEDIRFILEAAHLNEALSQEGLRNVYGLHIGKTLQTQRDRGLLSKDLMSEIMIRTSAASDARMGGAVLPAMSNSGSGNQGIAATMPVVVTADYLQSSEEQLARALMLSHLMAIYIHNQLPALSALCAATTAAMGAAAGIAWLLESRYEVVAMAISSMIGDVSGMICDGASNSCAMKVSTSASAAYKAVLMALDNSCVRGSDGIVSDDVDQSIANLCSLAAGSMRHTDLQIIEIMAAKARP